MSNGLPSTNGIAGGLAGNPLGLDAVSGLAGGDTIGGLGQTLGGVAGGLPVAGDLLGGGQGLNVAGLVGVGSDQGMSLSFNTSHGLLRVVTNSYNLYRRAPRSQPA